MIDPVALATITSAVTVLGSDYAKGIATEAGKASWAGIKGLFKWHEDPAPAEVPAKVATALTASPELAAALLELLKKDSGGAAAALVGNLQNNGGKVVIGAKIDTVNM